jgi:hypothetical protein
MTRVPCRGRLQTDTGGAPHEVKEHTASRLAAQQAETAGLLGRHLGLYQIHSATLESGVLQARPSGAPQRPAAVPLVPFGQPLVGGLTWQCGGAVFW